MSERYEVIAGMLSNFGNRLIAKRELLRLELEDTTVVPPIQRKDGVSFFLTEDSYLSRGTKLEHTEELLRVYSDATGNWNAGFLNFHDDSKIPHFTLMGPFSSEKEALAEVFRLFKELEWVYLEEDPWDKKDLKEYR